MAFTTVTGKIGRTFYNGKGAEIVESWQSNGETMTKRWSAFFESEHGLVEGAEVTISGIHGDKVDDWEKDGQTRHTVKRTLNKAKVKTDGNQSEPAQSAPAAPSEPAGDVWNTPGSYSDETPF